MANITVDNIYYRNNNTWLSLREEQIYSNGSWRSFSDGSGIYKNNNWYILRELNWSDIITLNNYYTYNTSLPMDIKVTILPTSSNNPVNYNYFRFQEYEDSKITPWNSNGILNISTMAQNNLIEIKLDPDILTKYKIDLTITSTITPGVVFRMVDLYPMINKLSIIGNNNPYEDVSKYFVNLMYDAADFVTTPITFVFKDSSLTADIRQEMSSYASKNSNITIQYQ